MPENNSVEDVQPLTSVTSQLRAPSRTIEIVMINTRNRAAITPTHPQRSPSPLWHVKHPHDVACLRRLDRRIHELIPWPAPQHWSYRSSLSHYGGLSNLPQSSLPVSYPVASTSQTRLPPDRQRELSSRPPRQRPETPNPDVQSAYPDYSLVPADGNADVYDVETSSPRSHEPASDLQDEEGEVELEVASHGPAPHRLSFMRHGVDE